jgi:3',5'-cyclic AMP phosphodiesterase CpdA
MDVTRLHNRLRLFLMAGAFIGCWTERSPDHLPSTRDTLRSIGRRMSRSCSERDLTAIASRSDLVLERLRPNERAALARGYLRFHVDSPVLVDVAVPAKSIPFWIADLGFRPTNLVLESRGTAWRLFEKAFGPGSIGLGVNNLDRTPEAHYVVFIRPSNPRKTSSQEPRVGLDASQALLWRTELARPYVSAAHDVYEPFTKMPSELVGAILLQASHAQRHSALLATSRVWKTRVLSTASPSQVTVSFGSDAAHELVWTWTTSPDVESSCIRLTPVSRESGRSIASASADGGTEPTRVVLGESTLIEVPNLLNDPIIRRHMVVVDRLEPDTMYRYSLGDGTSDRWGPWQTVKTSPDSSRGVRFLYLGDAQTGLERWGRLLQTAVRRHPSDFILMAGDLVDRGNERTNWDHFFLRAAGVFDCVPLLPCAGNHEYLDRGPRLYRAFFELPRNGPAGIDPDLVYHFESGGAFFAVLDSTLAVSDPDQAARQATWLDAALEQTRATWKFVLFHHPVYPSHPWRDTPVLRKHWVPIFDKHHVDFVLQGHDHAYLRTYPLRAHRRALGPDEGTTYLVAVSGDKFVDQPHRDYIAVGFTGKSTYQTFDIDEQAGRLLYRAWTEDGKVVDELRIDKAAKSQFARPPRNLASGQRDAHALKLRSQVDR